MITKRLLIIFSIIIFLVVNLPIWWRTTGAFQTELPYEAIKVQLNASTPLQHQLPVYLCVHFIGSRNFIEHHQGKQFAEPNSLRDKKKVIPFQIISQKYSIASDAERQEILRESIDEHRFDDLLLAMSQTIYEDRTGQFTLYVFEDVNNEGVLKKDHLYLGSHRQAWISDHELFDQSRLLQYIENVHDIITFNYQSNEELQIISSSNRYRLTFTLINQNPSSNYIIWDFNKMEQRYLKPFLSKISPLLLTNVTVDSQIINYAQLPSTPTFNQETETFELKASEMQLFLNENDFKLDSYAHTDPTVHFLLFVPQTENSPLRVLAYEKETQPLTDDSYVIPRWGGITILNTEKNAGESNELSDEQERIVMQSFIEQMRMLLALPSYSRELKHQNLNVHFVPDQLGGISDWELDQLIRLRILQNMATARHSLESLSKVVAKMPNVLVMQEVAQYTEETLKQMNITTDLLKKGIQHPLNYDDLIVAAKLSVEYSEKAYFHPSMISLLHFPDSQKMAIYLPLLLPVVVTVLTSAFRELKYTIQKKRA